MSTYSRECGMPARRRRADRRRPHRRPRRKPASPFTLDVLEDRTLLHAVAPAIVAPQDPRSPENGSPTETPDTGPSSAYLDLAESAGPVGNPYPFDTYVAGYIYWDLDNDGIRDTGNEPGIRGQTVHLVARDGSTSIAVTDEYGKFIFHFVPPGTYSLIEEQPDGYVDGMETLGAPFGGVIDPAANDTIRDIVVPTADVIADNYNFAELKPVSISGSVYVDHNENGRRDTGEEGIPGVQILLTRTDGQRGPASFATVTDANGTYRFENIPPGQYQLSETQPAGFDDGLETVGTSGGRVMPPDAIGGIMLIGDPLHATGYDFGETPLVHTLSGYVFDDGNNNGVMDAGEPGIAGVTVGLIGENEKFSTTTNSAGFYGFDNLRPGEYVLREVQPAGYLDGRDAPGTRFGGVAQTDGDEIRGIRIPFDVVTRVGERYNFGELKPSRLSGDVYADENSNGRRDGFETGIAGVAITLVGYDDRGEPVFRTLTTGADGGYLFDGLRPGVYDIRQTRSALLGLGTASVGSLGGIRGGELVSSVVVGPGGFGTGYHFGKSFPEDPVLMSPDNDSDDMDMARRNGLRTRIVSEDLSNIFGPINFEGEMGRALARLRDGRSLLGGATLAALLAAQQQGRVAPPTAIFDMVVSASDRRKAEADLFSPEPLVLQPEEDARLSAALAAALVTGGRVRATVGAQKGPAVGSVAMIARDDAEGGENLGLAKADEFSLPRALIGPMAPAGSGANDPGHDRPATSPAESDPAAPSPDQPPPLRPWWALFFVLPMLAWFGRYLMLRRGRAASD